MKCSPHSPPANADHGRLLRPHWLRPRAHSDSGLTLAAAIAPLPLRVLNVPPSKRQSIAAPQRAHRASSSSSSDWRDWKEESCRRNVAELLARHVLDITGATAPPLAAQVAPHAPLLVEDPPSTADEEDDDFLRVGQVARVPVAGGPAPAPKFPNELLNGSSGNLSSTKSAPATPVGERLQAAPATTSGTTRRRAPGPPTVAPSVSTPTLVPLPSPATSKARHKKFHRHFDSVAPDERVLNYYSCALISDILLQGHLYITSNYFAFYSNVFGYVTKVLIPTASVLKVSKEKTARIIPNAVGVATSDEKHVFGSLLSRDNTYKLMVQVWKTALGSGSHQPSLSPQPLARALPIAKDLKDEADSASASGDVLQEDDDSSLSGDAGLPPVPLDKIPIVAATCPVPRTASVVTAVAAAPGVAHAHAHAAAVGPGLGLHDTQWGRSPRQTFVLTVSTVLVAFLLVSTAFLYHRMSRIQDQFRINSGDNLYQDLARWQNHLHTRSAGQVEEFLNTHLDQLAKVRKSLEALTMLIVSNDEDRMQQADGIIHQHHSTYQDQKHHTRPPSLGKDGKES